VTVLVIDPRRPLPVRQLLENNIKQLPEGQALFNFDPEWLTLLGARPLPDGGTLELHADPPAGKRAYWKIWVKGGGVVCFSGSVKGSWKEGDLEGVFGDCGVVSVSNMIDGVEAVVHLELD
jgi:hypothetical protein